MTKKVLISVIIPIFNTEMYLKNCLNSLLSQTLENIEIICIDDGSTDNSLDIAKEFAKKDKRIKILKQKHNKQGSARNLGLKEAKGEYIGFVDSDDWVEVTMFEKLYQKAISTNADITMCSFTVFNEKTGALSKNDSYVSLDIFPKDLDNKVFSPKICFDYLFRICVSPCNKIYKKSFLDFYKIKFPHKLYFEDNVFFLESFLQAKNISLIRDCCYYYRLCSQTSTCFKNDKNKLDMIKIFKIQENLLKKLNLYKNLKNSFQRNKKNTLVYWYKKIKDPKIKFIYFILMISAKPTTILEPIHNLAKEFLFLWNLYSLHKRNRKIVFWGATVFLENLIKKYKINYENILGIIDTNPNKQGCFISNYQIYSPDEIGLLHPEEIVISVINFSKETSTAIQNHLINSPQKDIKLTRICK